jgi:6-hydroxycyclohex-1-ene-1-carbonyl-CoA dehydrogenase
MTGAGEPLVPVEFDVNRPGPDEVVVEIDACVLCCMGLGYNYGDVHTKRESSPVLRHMVSGHVVEAGANALYYTDRAVVIPVTLPSGQRDACWFGARIETSGNETHGGCANSIIVPVRELHIAEKLGSVSSKSGWVSFNYR